MLNNRPHNRKTVASTLMPATTPSEPSTPSDRGPRRPPAKRIITAITAITAAAIIGAAATIAWGPAPTPANAPLIPAHPAHSDTLTLPPHARNLELKILVLSLINQARAANALAPLSMGANDAAQRHADRSLQTCTGSHWSADGLKPYTRYSLAGGYQRNAENWSNIGHCGSATPLKTPVETLLTDSVAGLLRSPPHRANLLDPEFTRVNIGIAWDPSALNVAQHFETTTAHMPHPPAIGPKGLLNLGGTTVNLPALSPETAIAVTVNYDPPPNSLTRRQTAATNCYQLGPVVTRLRPPPKPGYEYQETHWNYSTNRPLCPDPHHQPSGPAGRILPEDEAQLFQQAKAASLVRAPEDHHVPFINAQKWKARQNSFHVSADISQILKDHGPGIYTVTVTLNQHPAKTRTIAQYSIFHGIHPPKGN